MKLKKIRRKRLIASEKYSEISGIVKMLTSCLTNWQSLHAVLRWVFVRAELEDKEAFCEVTCMYGFKVGDREL